MRVSVNVSAVTPTCTLLAVVLIASPVDTECEHIQRVRRVLKDVTLEKAQGDLDLEHNNQLLQELEVIKHHLTDAQYSDAQRTVEFATQRGMLAVQHALGTCSPFKEP